MNRYTSIRIGLLIIALLFSTFLSAQTEVTELQEVTISASRLPSNVIDLPASISQLDSLTINKSTQNLSVKEYLQQVPGVYVQNAYNFAQDARISIRGFGATAAFGIRGIKLVVDGIPETTPDGTGQLDNLNLDLINRIRIIRGSTSSLYGNASGGAILINSNFDFERNFLTSKSTLGSYGFYSQSLTGGLKKNNASYVAHVRTFGSDGYRGNNQFNQTNARFVTRHQWSDRVTAVFLAEFVDSPKAQDAGGLTQDEVELDRRQPRDRNLMFNAGEAITQWKTGASVNWKLSSGKDLNSYAFFNRRVFDGRLPFENSGVIELTRNYFGIGNSLNLETGKHSIKVGYDLLSQNDHRYRFDNLSGSIGLISLDQRESFLNVGVYIIDYLELNRWYLSAGLRYDFNELTATDRFISDGDDSGTININNGSYHVGVGRMVSSTLQLFTNYSSSFETPTLNQLSNRPDNTGGFNALNAANASTLELGMKWNQNKVGAELVTFRTSTTKELVPYELMEFPERTFYQNAGNTLRKGIEFSMNYSSRFWRVNVAYTYSDFSYKSFLLNGVELNGFALPGIPKNHMVFSLTATPIESLEISIPIDYVGSMYANNSNDTEAEDYLEVSFSIRYETRINGLFFTPYFGVRNLTNTEYFDNIRINAFAGRYYEPAPDRNFYAGIVLKLESLSGS